MGFLTELLAGAALSVFWHADISDNDSNASSIVSETPIWSSSSGEEGAQESSPLSYRHRSKNSTTLFNLAQQQAFQKSPRRHRETIEDWEIRQLKDLRDKEKTRLWQQKVAIKTLRDVHIVMQDFAPRYEKLMEKDPGNPVFAIREAFHSHRVFRQMIFEELRERVRQLVEDIRNESSEPIDASKCDLGPDSEESFERALYLMHDLEDLCWKRRRKEMERLVKQRDGRNDSAIKVT